LVLCFQNQKHFEVSIAYYPAILGPIYTWRTLTGVNLNNNWTQYSRPAIFLAA